MSGTSLHDDAPWAPGSSVGLSLLTPTVIYVRDVAKMLGSGADVRGLVHMTGGGFPENIPRVVPKGLAARVRRDAWEVPALFQWLQQVRARARAGGAARAGGSCSALAASGLCLDPLSTLHPPPPTPAAAGGRCA